MLMQLFAGYSAAPDAYDEMLDAQRRPRPHWRALLDSLVRESPDRMRERFDAVRRQVRENGVTYNVYTDAQGAQRPWDLNLLPLILPHEEWAGIEAAVSQRAGLLNKILADVYGAQELLAEGLLPPALIHGHAGFLRPCHAIRHPDGIALHLYAADLARAPDGRWWVVTDRTQAPSGAGYALENRSVIARVFPDLMREMKVQPLSGFFEILRDSLAHWGRRCAANTGAPLRDSEPPLIVLMTPGPYNETYFEQAYLARQLGLPLVEGGDLTVRNGVVWLKTLSGMQRVHVILRRVDDDYCDPLELRADSALGVAGLTEAARRGSVLIANGLGSSLLESGALLGYLPALCERLLGERLKMPSVDTWWCGEPAAMEQAIGALDRLVIKPSFPQLRRYPVFGSAQTAAGRAALIERIRAEPGNYLAQDMVRLSQAPVWKPDSGGLRACAIGLRVFACATPNGYAVMPGGLTRVATGPDTRAIVMQRGGGSQDTWVQVRSHLHTPQPFVKRTITGRDLIRDDTHLSSRMAENLLWFGRNAERCDNIARLMRVALNFLVNVRPAYRGAEWPTVERLCAHFHLIGESAPHATERGFSDAQIEAALLQAVVSPDVPGLARQQQQTYRVAGQLRERLSVDNWRALNRMMRRVGNTERRLTPSEAMNALDEAAAASMAITGFALDGMTRDLGWRFLSLGRRLERLQFQCVALRHALGMDPDGSLDWLLELSDSIITYRSRYQAQPEWLPVLDLLVLDHSNPRAILFQLEGIQKGMHKLAAGYGASSDDGVNALTEELLQLAPEADFYCGNAHLSDLLRRIYAASVALSDRLGERFFSYTGAGQRRERLS